MTKHEAMQNYVEGKVEELVGKMVSFNFSNDSPQSISFLTNYAGKVVKNYVRGAEKEYGFTILITWPFSTGTDEMNVDAMNFAQSFMEWIDEQNHLGKFPDFGEKCQVKKVENLQNMPNLASVDWENGIAQYMIQSRVLYFEKKIGG